MRTFLRLLFIYLLLVFPAKSGYCSEPDFQAIGLVIAHEADNRDRGFGDFTADIQMVIKNREGDSSIRKLRIKAMETEHDGDKSLLIFDTPRDVRGTALLSYAHKKNDDDQWLYLPALKRVKRIASRNKSGSFMGSEFAYEDIAGQELEKYTYQWLRDENFAGQECFVLERTPVNQEYSGYSRLVSWLDKQEYRALKIEFYDRKNALLKTLILSGYQRYLSRYWRAAQMEMLNHQTGKSTSLSWSNFRFGQGLTDRDFDKNSLRQVR
jgi:outer membrane lipoprotein-sorting protein